MSKFNVEAIRFLDAQHFRILTSIEMGMKNHELVPLPLISSIAAIHRGATARSLNDLTRSSLVVYERGKKYDGYHLSSLGYDFLALRALCARGVVGAVGNQIGVGKESDIYVGGTPELKRDVVLKFHRLGRTSFRKIKEKRDYHRRRHFCSWLYLSRLAATKEFAFLKALHAHHFPVPEPIDVCRHTVVMSLITGPPLCNVSELRDAPTLYEKLMKLIVRLGSYGLIHGDFNEFNIMLMDDESPVLIDFPQMVSMDHPNAEFYFNRDVQCVRTFFRRRFHFDATEWPRLEDIKRKHNLDVELEASGFTKKMRLDLNRAYDEGNFNVHMGDISEAEEDEEESDGDANGAKQDNEFDGEELEAVEEEAQQRDQQLRGSERFQHWLSHAREELDSLNLAEGTLTGEQLDDILGAEREQMAEEVMARVKRQMGAVDGEEEPDSGEEEIEVGKESGRNGTGERSKADRQRQKLVEATAGSVLSAGSTIIPPEEVKRRLLSERGKAKKERLRVKGRQSAVRRGRQQNQELIREYAGWDQY